MKKVGSDTPAVASSRDRWSAHEPGRVAERAVEGVAKPTVRIVAAGEHGFIQFLSVANLGESAGQRVEEHRHGGAELSARAGQFAGHFHSCFIINQLAVR